MGINLLKNYSNLEDDMLMDLIGKGQQKAFGVLFERYGSKLLGYAAKILNSKERAEEVTQEIWIKVVKLAPQYEAKGYFKAWVMTMTRNHCLNIIRKDSRLHFSDDVSTYVEEDMESSSIEEEVIFNENLEKVSQALNTLPEKQRLALSILYTEELSYDELAQQMDVSLPALKSIIHRGRKAINELIKNEEV